MQEGAGAVAVASGGLEVEVVAVLGVLGLPHLKGLLLRLQRRGKKGDIGNENTSDQARAAHHRGVWQNLGTSRISQDTQLLMTKHRQCTILFDMYAP